MTQVSLPCAYACSTHAQRMPIHTVVGCLSASASVASTYGIVGLTTTAAWEDARQHRVRFATEAEAHAAGYRLAGNYP